jgi:hypothetical protein
VRSSLAFAGIVGASLACGLLFGGCAVKRETVVPVIDVATVSLRLDPEGPWHEASANTEAAASAEALVAERRARAAVAPPRPPPTPPAERLPVPVARGLSEAAPQGKAPSRPLEEVARERFLDHPTEIKAQQVTLYAPASVLAEGRLKAADVTEPTPGRRIAVGEASLALRELTLTAERITLRTREGALDIQITARGDVHLVSRQRDRVIREEGLKSLILTNDQITPLR